MAIIYSYPLNTPKRDDLLIGTITYDEDAVNPVHGNPTVSFTVGSLLDLIASQGAAQNLQQVTNIGNTTTNSIVISNSLKVAGEYYDSSNQPGTAGQLLSSTATGTQWVNVAAQGVTSVGLSMPAAFTVANSPITQSGTLTVTGVGTTAQYINGLGNLVTFPTIPTQYVLPVATTVALGGIKIGYTENGKNYPLELDNEQAYVNVPWTDTPYVLPLAADGTRGGVQIGYVENAKNYPVELSSEKMFVNVPWTDTPYVLPVATATDLGGVKIGYTENAKNYPVELASDKMFVNVPWTDTQNPFQTITGAGSDNTDSGIILSNSGGTVLILGSGSVTAAQSGNTIMLTGVNTWVANAVTVAGYVAAPAATDANLVWKTDANGNPAWRVDATIPDTGITGVTLDTGTSTGAPLSESIANRELTLTSLEYDGGSNIGYVPAGGTATTYLKGDGSWAAIPTGLQFKGTWDASGGGGGNPDLTQGANKGAGFLWICDVAGTAYPNGGSNPPSTWALGDWAVYDGTAWTRVPATNAGVTSVTTTDGTYIDLTPASPTAAIGNVTVTADLSATGTQDNTTFLRGDNTWAVPAYIPNTDETYDLNAGAKVSTSVPINLTSTSGTDNSFVNLKEGTNVTLTRGSATEITIAATDSNTQNIYTNSWQQSTNDIILRKVLSGAGSGTQDIKIVKGANITFTYTDANNFTIAATDTQENTTWYVRDSADADKMVDDDKYLKFVTATGTLGTALTGTGSTSDPYLMTLTSPDTNTPLSVATSTVLGGIELGSDTVLTQTYETGVTGAQNRTYPVQLNANRQAAVSVPWVSGGTYTWTIKDNSTGSSAVDSGEKIEFVTATGVLGTALTEPSAGNFVMTLTSPNDQYALAGAASATAGEYDLVLSNDGTDQDTMVFKQGSNVTFTRAANSLTIEAANDNDNTTYDFLAVQTGNPASNDDPALRLDPSVGSSDDVTLTGGSNMTITRNSDTQITFDATNTWNANTKTVAGYVAAPGAVASKVWKTDGSGNPAWRDDATGDNTTYTIGSGNTKVITLTGSDSSTSTVTFKDGSDISISSSANNEITITNDSPDSGLPAVLTDGANPGVTSLWPNTTADAVRATIGAGTGDGDVTLTGTQTLTNKTLTTPVIDQISPSAGLVQVDGAGSVDGGIKLMCYAGTHGQTLKSQPHSAGVTNTMLLPAGANSTLVSEATETFQSLTTTGTSGAATLSSAGVLNIPQYSDNNDVDYINAATFDTSNGILTGTGVGNAGFSVDLDGRYLTSGVTGSGTTNTVPRWSSSSSLSDGPITFFQNAIATWESADANFGGRIVVGGLTDNTVDASIHIGRTNSNNETYILMRTGTGSTDYQNWALGIDASDGRNFKIGDGVNPSSGNTYLEINTSGDLKIYEKLVVGDTSLSATKGQVDIKGISGLITTSLGQANQSHLNLRVTNTLNRQGQIVWSSDVNVYTFGLGAIGMVMTAAATGTNTGTADMIFSTKSGAADAASTERMRITSSGNVGIGTGSSPSGKFHVKVGTSTPLIVASSSYCNNVGIRTTTPTASLQVKGNISYSYVNYTNVANTWMSVISMAGYPTGLYQISIIKKTNASTYISAIIKWDDSGSGSGSIVGTVTSNQLSVSFNNTTTLQAISGISTGTAMSANLKCLVMNEDSCS